MPPCCCAAWKAIGTEPLSWNTIVRFWGVCVLSVGAGVSLCAALFTCWNITLIPERTPWGPFGPKQWRQAVFNTPHSALLSFSTIYSGCWGESRNVVQLWGITHPVCFVCKQQMWQRLCLLFCQFICMPLSELALHVLSVPISILFLWSGTDRVCNLNMYAVK